MATLITEKMRKPGSNSWIPLRQIVEENSKIKVLDLDPSSNEDNPTKINYADGNGNVLPVGYKNGEITSIDSTVIVKNKTVQSVSSPLVLKNGQFETEDAFTALRNLDLKAQKITASKSIIWDGNTENKSPLLSTGYAWKVSDGIFYPEDFINGTLEKTDSDGTVTSVTLTSDYFSNDTGSFLVCTRPVDKSKTMWALLLSLIGSKDLGATMGVFYISPEAADEEDDYSAGLYFFKTESTTGEGYIYTSKFVSSTKQETVIDIPSGGTGATTAVDALRNLGFHWGEQTAAEYWESQGKSPVPNSIYIQLIPVEEE